MCGVWTWRTVLVGERTRVRMISKPGTRRCRVFFKVCLQDSYESGWMVISVDGWVWASEVLVHQVPGAV